MRTIRSAEIPFWISSSMRLFTRSNPINSLYLFEADKSYKGEKLLQCFLDLLSHWDQNHRHQTLVILLVETKRQFSNWRTYNSSSILHYFWRFASLDYRIDISQVKMSLFFSYAVGKTNLIYGNVFGISNRWNSSSQVLLKINSIVSQRNVHKLSPHII